MPSQKLGNMGKPAIFCRPSDGCEFLPGRASILGKVQAICGKVHRGIQKDIRRD